MAISLVTTSGAVNANGYCSLTEANTYFTTRLHKTVWEDAEDDDKKAAIIWATRILDDAVQWKGFKASETQALRWPREYVPERDYASLQASYYDTDLYDAGVFLDGDEIPTFLKNATAEFSMFLLSEDRTLETNRDLLGFKRMKVDTIEMDVDPWTKKPTLPASVWEMIKWYAAKPGGKTLSRA
jgi:hypothetical protein